MDRFLIIDLQNMEIISANDIDFKDQTDGGSEKYDDPAEFGKGIYKTVEQVLAQHKTCHCPFCGGDLSKSLGVSQKADQVMFADGGQGEVEYGETLEYYCPNCGKTIPYALGDTLTEKYYE